MAIARNIEFYYGETWTMDTSCFNANNKPLNLTDALISFRLSDNRWNTVFNLTNPLNIVVTNALAGQCSVVVTPAVQSTANIVDKTYKYELQVILGDGTVSTQCVGELEVNASLFGPWT